MRPNRKRNRRTNTWVILGLGLIIGFLLAGPIHYNGIISDLRTQLSNGGSDEVLMGELSVAGSTTLLPITQECATQFMEINSLTQISVAGGGSGHGIKSAGSGEVDIGESSRNIKESELLKYPDLVIFSIGKDSVAVVINSNNPLAGNSGIYSVER